jgi:hypothetical protein
MRLFPQQFIRVRAYLLEEGVPPLTEVVIGLATVRDNCDLHVGRAEDFLLFEDGSRVPLDYEAKPSNKDRQLIVPRLRATVFFEPAKRSSANPPMIRAIVDTGAPYVIVPHLVHKFWSLRYHNLDRRYYGSLVGQRKDQPFCEIGLKFVANL